MLVIANGTILVHTIAKLSQLELYTIFIYTCTHTCTCTVHGDSLTKYVQEHHSVAKSANKCPSQQFQTHKLDKLTPLHQILQHSSTDFKRENCTTKVFCQVSSTALQKFKVYYYADTCGHACTTVI